MTENICKWTDLELQLLVKELSSNVKDTTDFIKKLEEINKSYNLPENSLLVTWDVKSLYTNITHKECLDSVFHFLQSTSTSRKKIEVILHFTDLILTSNIFRFGSDYFLQKSGIAMGNVTAPSLANLLMGLLKKNLLSKCSKKPLVWFRYINDVFFIWTHSKEDLDDFLIFCNSYDPNIQFHAIPPSKNTPFLDVSVIIENGKLICDLYTKPTDNHLFLGWSSCHPVHTKQNLPYSIALRIRRICTRLTDFEKNAKELRSYLIARGYKLKNIKDSINKARKISRYDILNKNDQD